MSEPEHQQRVSFVCRHCGVHSHGVVCAVEPYLDEDDQIDYRYQLVRCTACFDLSLLIAMGLGWHNDQEIFDTDVAVYPAPPQRLGAAVPETIRSCFDEVRACYEARAFTAAAIMCRRALELLAASRGVKEQNLARSIEKMRDQGDIDQKLFEWCTTLRFAGNSAAHDVTGGVSQVDAMDMRDLVEAIVDYVFVYQARFEQFNQRRNRRSE